MVAYFDWMKGETKAEEKVAGRGVGKIDRSIKPDSDNGKKIYAKQCAVCHGEKGEGLRNAAGGMIYPPLWGDESFNIGAGMARTYTADRLRQAQHADRLPRQIPTRSGRSVRPGIGRCGLLL